MQIMDVFVSNEPSKSSMNESGRGDYRVQLLRGAVIRNVPNKDLPTFKTALLDILQDINVLPKTSVQIIESCKEINSSVVPTVGSAPGTSSVSPNANSGLYLLACNVAGGYLAETFLNRPERIGPRMCQQVECFLRAKVIKPSGLMACLEECVKNTKGSADWQHAAENEGKAVGGSDNDRSATDVMMHQRELQQYLLVLQSILRVCPQIPVSSNLKRVVIDCRSIFPKLARSLLMGEGSRKKGNGPTEVKSCLLEAHECMKISVGHSETIGYSLASDRSEHHILMGCDDKIIQIDFHKKMCIDQIEVFEKKPDDDPVSVVSMAVNNTGDKLCAALTQRKRNGKRRNARDVSQNKPFIGSGESQLAHLWKDHEGVWQLETGWQSDGPSYLHVSRVAFLGDLMCAGVVTERASSLAIFDGPRTLLRNFCTLSPVSDITVLDHFNIGVTTRAPSASVSIFDLRNTAPDHKPDMFFSMSETDLTSLVVLESSNHALAAGEGVFLFDRRMISKGPIAGGLLDCEADRGFDGFEKIGNIAIRMANLRIPGMVAISDAVGLSTIKLGQDYSQDLQDNVLIPPPTSACVGTFSRKPFFDILAIDEAVFGCNADGLSYYRCKYFT